jgi:glycine/D-amino acid oxidase-like deaminating enzyme
VKPKILVVGDLWTAPLFAYILSSLGQDTDVWVCESPHYEGPEAVYVGNGETREKAGLIFGESLAARVWEIAQANFESAHKTLQALGVPLFEKQMQRVDATTVSEPAFSFSSTGLAQALENPVSSKRRFRRLKAVQSRGLETAVQLETATGVEEVHAPMAVIATESFDQHAVPWLSDKRIPVTLSSYLVPPVANCTAAFTLFNSGADFAVQDGVQLRLGSVRNLYADHGVGLHASDDPRTREGITRFFTSRGWLAPGVSLQPTLRIESLPCDGIPLVGTLPGLPGAVFVTGFAARGPNFIFEVAQRVARSMLGQPTQSLEIFSPRRLL